jgi:hypothetical protein
MMDEVDGPTDTNPSVKKLRRVLKTTVEKKQSDLRELLQSSLNLFTEHMFSEGLVSKEVKNQPEFTKIMGEFTAHMQFIDDQYNLEGHCCKLLNVLDKLGSPTERAAQMLEELWTENALKEANVKIQLRCKTPHQAHHLEGGYYYLHSPRAVSSYHHTVVNKPPNQMMFSHAMNRSLVKARRNSAKRLPPRGELPSPDYTTEIVQSNDVNQGTIWLPQQPSSSHRKVSGAHEMLVTSNFTSSPHVMHFTDPSYMERFSHSAIPSDSVNPYSAVIHGSDIITHVGSSHNVHLTIQDNTMKKGVPPSIQSMRTGSNESNEPDTPASKKHSLSDQSPPQSLAQRRNVLQSQSSVDSQRSPQDHPMLKHKGSGNFMAMSDKSLGIPEGSQIETKIDDICQSLHRFETKINDKVDHIHREMDQFHRTIDQKNLKVDHHLGLDQLDAKINEKLNQLDCKVDQLSARVDQLHRSIEEHHRIGQVETRVADQLREFKIVLVAVIVVIITVLFACLLNK